MYHPEKTAIKRSKMTKPTEWLFQKALPSLDLHPTSVLDYGAGKSVDVDLLPQLRPGLVTGAWDPYPHAGFEHRTAWPAPGWDLVMVNFVLNVLDTEEERLDVVRRASSLLAPGGLLWLCTRSRRHIDQLGTKKGWARTPNGSWLSSPSKRTVQFGMDSDHLEALCHRSGVSLTRLSLPGNPTTEARAVLMRIMD